jgi:hypothetical protein
MAGHSLGISKRSICGQIPARWASAPLLQPARPRAAPRSCLQGTITSTSSLGRPTRRRCAVERQGVDVIITTSTTPILVCGPWNSTSVTAGRPVTGNDYETLIRGERFRRIGPCPGAIGCHHLSRHRGNEVGSRGCRSQTSKPRGQRPGRSSGGAWGSVPTSPRYSRWRWHGWVSCLPLSDQPGELDGSGGPLELRLQLHRRARTRHRDLAPLRCRRPDVVTRFLSPVLFVRLTPSLPGSPARRVRGRPRVAVEGRWGLAD